MNKKLIAVAGIAAIGALALTGCTSDAEQASYNLSKEADQFNIERNITFYNGITNEIIADFTGFCSITDESNQLEVTCKNGPDSYTKDFLGLSDNVTYIALQTEGKDVSLYHRKVIIKPENILPEFDLETGEQ